MAEYVNKVTGARVSVADDLVLSTDFERVDVKASPKKPAAKKPAEESASVEESK